jgi:hypothetical protein
MTQCVPAIPIHGVSKKLPSVESTAPRIGKASPTTILVTTLSTEDKITSQDGSIEFDVRGNLYKSDVGRKLVACVDAYQVSGNEIRGAYDLLCPIANYHAVVWQHGFY